MTLRRFLPVVVSAVLFSAAAVNAWAAHPYPPACTVDPCVRVCPTGDMAFHVVVRDATSKPIPFASVAVEFTQCPGVFLCPLTGSEPYSISPPATVDMTVNFSGAADIPIRASGICSGGLVNVYANGQLIAQRPVVASPDQDGNAVVNATDQAIMAAKISGSYDPTADLDCDNTLGAGDAGIQNAHLGHACSAAVPVTPGSWGRIKSIYR